MKQIPNILSSIRILMVPLFVVLYFSYPEGCGVYWTAGVYYLAWVTDVLDGYLARRNNWITNLGKILDPLADKLMQFVVAICFTIDNTIFLCLLIPLVIKEISMLLGALLIVRRKRIVVSSSWYGKLSSVIHFLCALTRIIVRGNPVLDIVLCSLMVSAMVFALVMYYFKDFKGQYNISLFRKNKE